MVTVVCQNCSEEFQAQRKTRKFCSVSCANRSKWRVEKERPCRQCGNPIYIRSAADANRQHCSQACAKKSHQKSVESFYDRNPGYMERVQKNRVIKTPGMWRDKHKQERLTIIQILGGRCIVCGVTNPNWLHVDYIPTTRNKTYRHPRHLKYIKEHAEDFRLLCANHHYELTLTGMIEGTEITQVVQ